MPLNGYRYIDLKIPLHSGGDNQVEIITDLEQGLKSALKC